MNEIHKKIRALRKQTGATLEVMGKAIKMSKGNLSRVERGEVSLSMEWLEKIANYFGVPVEQLANVPVNRNDPAVMAILEKEKQILKMQVNTEEFIRSFLSAASKNVSVGGKEESYELQALKQLFDLPGIEFLLSGINTRPEFMLLSTYEDYKATRSKESLKELILKIQADLQEQ